MPSVGSVTFHVDIDARDLGAKLTAAVHEAVGPALAGLQRDLAGKLGGIGGRRNTNYAGANADLDKHIRKLNEYHGVLGQVNLMWDRFLARMTIAGSLISTIAPIIGLLGGAVGVLGGGIGALVGGLGAVGAGMSAMIPMILGVAGALKIGFAGLKEGAKAYMAQFDDANKVIAAQIGNMMGPMLTAWQEVSARIKLDFAQALVPAFNNLGALIRGIGPALSAVGQAFGTVANNVTAGLLAAQPQINAILAGSKQFLTAIGPGIQVLTKGIFDLGVAAQAAMPAVADAVRSALSQVGASMSQMAASPVFTQALAGFGQIIAQIGGLLSNLVPVLIQIGATAGPVFAQMIGALGPSLNTLLMAFGQLATTVGPIFNQFLAGLGPILAQVVLGLGQMGQIVGPTLIPLLQGLADALQPLYVPLAQLGKILSEQLATILPTIGAGLASLVGPIVQALPTLGTLINVLAQIVVAAGPALIGLAQGIGAIAQGLMTGLQPLIPVINQFAQVLAPILLQIGQAIGQVLAAAGPTIAALVQALTPLVGVLGNVIVVGVQALADVITAAAPFITQFFQMLATAFNQAAPQINALITQLGTLLPQILTQLLPIMVQLAPQFMAIGLQITQAILPVLPQLLELLNQFLQALIPLLPAIVQVTTIGLRALVDVLPLLLLPMRANIEALKLFLDAMKGVGDFATSLGQGLAEAFNGIKNVVSEVVNWLIDQYDSKIKPIWEAMRTVAPWMPAPPSFSHVGGGGMMGGGGSFAGPAGAPPGPGGPPLVHTPTTPIPGQLGNAAGARVGGAVPQQWAPPGAFTPVAPDLGKGGGKQGALNADDLPLDVVAKTPEQIKLLADIRGLLAGTGNSSAPLNTLKDMGPAVQTISETLKKTLPDSMLPPGATPGRMGPFGTPIAPRHPGYDAAAAAIQALGGKPEQWIGTNPIDYATQQWQTQVDAWKQTTTNQIQAWQQQAKQAPALTPQQMGGLPGMPPGWSPTNLPAGQGQSLWDLVAAAESGTPGKAGTAVWNQPGGGGIGPGGINPPRGGLQIKDETWKAFGGLQFAPTAAQATREQQVDIANRIAFAGYGGNKPQGLSAWQVIGEGKVPGVTTTTPASAFGGAPGIPGMPTAPGLPGPNLATAGSPVPVWIVGSGPLSAAGMGAAGTVAALPAGGAGLVSDTGTVPTTPTGLAIANAVKHWFPQIGTIGGSRPAGTSAPNTHDTGTSLDIPISDPAMGDQINQYLQQNAQQMGILYTIWRDQGLNAVGNPSGGAGSTFTAAGHGGPSGTGPGSHIDVHYGGGGGVGGLMPPAAGIGVGGMGVGGGVGGGVVPVYVTNWPGQGQGGPIPGMSILGAGITAAGQAGATVAGDVTSAVGGLGLEPWVKRQPNADLSQLVREGNPLAVANMAGFNVQDFTRTGGLAPNQIAPAGQPYDASGRLFSDAAAMIDRTFTSLTAQIEAMKTQLLDVLNQVRDRVSEEVLKPIIQAAINAAMGELSKSTTAAIGTNIGNAAGPPIAAAVSSAMPSSSSDTGVGGLVTAAGGALTGAVFDTGGPWPTGTAGLNLSGGTEYVMTADEYARFGPPRAAFATKPGVIGNATVGAEFFGVSQIPIIGVIINLLVRVLLQIIGVQIEVRDTMNELTSQFRQFRGDAFKAFDAQGRLLNDTSGLIDRSMSSEKAVADERIRILKIVIQALIKYVIEKVIVPIVKAIAKAAVEAGAAAASSAINAGAGGGGQLVGALITSAGQAGVDVAGEVFGDFAVALSQVLIDMIGAGLQSTFPDLMTSIFSGAGLAAMTAGFGNMLGNALGGLGAGVGGVFGGGLGGGLAAIFATLLGGATMGGGGGFFDNGGLAVGTGLIPKGINAPELMLSPQETTAFDRLVTALERGSLGARTTIHAPFTVVGGEQGGQQAHDRLLALLS